MSKYADVEAIITSIRSVPRGNWSRDRYVKAVEDVPSIDVDDISNFKDLSSIKINSTDDQSNKVFGTMSRARIRELPATVRREMETITHFIRQCQMNNRVSEENHWTDVLEGYLQALVDVDVITELERKYLKNIRS